jgi:predicted RNA-binding Zn-ribbon protein involved in translation (DUF1610 family)
MEDYSRRGVVSDYVAPILKGTRFTCPHCGALASIGWNSIH